MNMFRVTFKGELPEEVEAENFSEAQIKAGHQLYGAGNVPASSTAEVDLLDEECQSLGGVKITITPKPVA